MLESNADMLKYATPALYSANAITSTRGRADPKRREIYVLLAKLE
jgi:hypothetical protein